MFVNSNVDVALDVDRNDGRLNVLDDVVNVEVLPSVMIVVDGVCDVDILLDDLVQVEVVVNVVQVEVVVNVVDVDDGDDEILLNEICSLQVVISSFVDVVVDDNVTDASASELDVEVLLDVVDEDVDGGVKVPEDECEACGDLSLLLLLLLLVMLLRLLVRLLK